MSSEGRIENCVHRIEMASNLSRGRVSWNSACEDKISEGVELCPFLRNIGVTTSFAFSNLNFPVPAPVSDNSKPFFPFTVSEKSRNSLLLGSPCTKHLDLVLVILN